MNYIVFLNAKQENCRTKVRGGGTRMDGAVVTGSTQREPHWEGSTGSRLRESAERASRDASVGSPVGLVHVQAGGQGGSN